METLQLKTNIHCEKCVEKLSPHLNEPDNITAWEVDLAAPEKLLTVSGHGISHDQVSEILGREGYKAIHPEQNDGTSFWSDISKWKRAAFNTFNCLLGCSIGDFGMIIFLQSYYPETSMMWQMILAIIAGLFTSILLETIILRVRESFNWMHALKTAFGMSFISMVGMELAMNTTDFMLTGGKAAFSAPGYWIALAASMVIGFLAPLPYNYYKLAKFNLACH